MEKENQQLSVWRPAKLLGHALVGGLVGLVCAVVPFSLALSRTNVRLSAVPKLPPGAEDPFRLGVKALIWGSIYSVSGVGVLTYSICWMVDVKNFSEFGKKMRTILPPKLENMRESIPKIKRSHRGHSSSPARHNYTESGDMNR